MTESQASSTSDKKPAAENTLVTGSLWKAIWTMSWPLLLLTSSNSLVGFVDVQVSGRLGSAAQAAVGVSEQVLFAFMIFLMSMAVGTTAIVSRAAGANEHEEVVKATGQSVAAAFLLGIGLSIISLSITGFGVQFLAKAPNVVALGKIYLSIYTFMLVPFSIICCTNAAYRAVGNAKTPLLIVLILTIINIAGDYLTVFGNWPVPNLGIRGIAFSALAADIVGSLVALISLNYSRLRDCFKTMLPLSLDYMSRLFKISVPSAFQRLGWVLSTFLLFIILRQCHDPTSALASWTIGMRIEALIFMPLFALSLAVASIVGQSLGANDTDRARRAGWHVTYMGIAMMILMGGAMFAFATPLARFMSTEPATILYTRDYLRINALAEPLLALNMVLSGALQGAGDTRTPMWITLFCNWIVRLPLAWFLAINVNLGPTGAWIAMALSIALSGILTVWRFQSGAWLKVKV